MLRVVWLVSFLLVSCQGMQLDGPLDLSWAYEENHASCLEDNFQFVSKKFNNRGSVWYAYNAFRVSEHCGTHMDAPYHFDPAGITLEKIPVNNFFVNAIIIDVRKDTGSNVNYTMPLSKVKDWESENGPIPDHSVVLIRFGWGAARYPNREGYLFKDAIFSFPGVHPEVSQYFIETKKVVGVGVDSPSIDAGYELYTNYSSHVSLLKAGIYILENVMITDEMILPPRFKLVVAPMKIAKGTGGPTRIIALPQDYIF